MSNADSSARTIFIIRHGEKPETPGPGKKPKVPFGVDLDGLYDVHSLLAVGWQRAGALATLFAPHDGHYRSGLTRPGQLIAPAYTTDPLVERTHETILPLSLLLKLEIESPFAEGDEDKLGKAMAASTAGVTLICWEHKGIPVIAGAICPEQAPFPKWPGTRFDVVWSFVREAGANHYTFGQIAERLLVGDKSKPITASTVL
jgi:hypothetical protein